MRRFLRAAEIGGISGAVLGAVRGALGWSAAWPSLSLANMVAIAAEGWLVGVLVGLAVAGLWALRASSATPGARRASRGASIAWAIAGFAPALLWPMVALSPGLGAGGRGDGGGRPNLILITIDALRADHVGAYGSRRGLTPHLDAFARRATLYRSVYAPAPWTLPSLGAMFSGRPPAQCGLKTVARQSTAWYVRSAALRPGVPVVAELLQRAGYRTGAETANVFLRPERGLSQGFDAFRNEGDAYGPAPDLTRADNVTRNALAWLRLNRRRPFFLWVHYLDPHTPYDSPETPPRWRAGYPRRWQPTLTFGRRTMESQDSAARRRRCDFCRRMYAEEVRYADRWVGELLAGLKRLGLDRNALIAITADHGEELFDHGGFEHGHSMHQEVLRVPLLVRWPRGVSADREIRQTVSLADLSGTLLTLARARPRAARRPPGGASWKSLPLRDGGPGDEVYSEAILYGAECTALTTDGYRVIYHPNAAKGKAEFEVYDRRADPSERRDLAQTDAAPAERARLKALTQAAQEAAHTGRSGGRQSSRQLKLSEGTRRQLKSLGYIGN
jgi:arylsulfatase A-like enzyme